MSDTSRPSWRSWRWWFEHRETGEITIAQFPNWPLWCIAACWILRALISDGTVTHEVLGWTTRVLWLVWGADEIARGVNPWRRLLGTAVIVSQIVAIATS